MRVLFLHGDASSAALQREWLHSSGWNACATAAGVEFVFIDGRVLGSARPEVVPMPLRAAYMALGAYYHWGQLDAKEPLEASIKYVQQRMVDLAPIDGLAGISSGALLATAIAAREPQLRCLINLSGAPWEQLHPAFRRALPSVPIHMPSLHMLSQSDDVFSWHELQRLPARCLQPLVLTHKHGHAIPRLSPVRVDHTLPSSRYPCATPAPQPINTRE